MTAPGDWSAHGPVSLYHDPGGLSLHGTVPLITSPGRPSGKLCLGDGSRPLRVQAPECTGD